MGIYQHLNLDTSLCIRKLTSWTFVSGEFEFACDICGKGFAIKSYLATHMKTHNTERPYECSLCNLSFKAKQGLVDHENRHLGLKAFQCDICEKRFITKSLCDAHLETHSSAEPKQEHPCNVCSKKFASKSSLKLHMKIHLDKQFMCEVGSVTQNIIRYRLIPRL